MRVVDRLPAPHGPDAVPRCRPRCYRAADALPPPASSFRLRRRCHRSCSAALLLPPCLRVRACRRRVRRAGRHRTLPELARPPRLRACAGVPPVSAARLPPASPASFAARHRRSTVVPRSSRSTRRGQSGSHDLKWWKSEIVAGLDAATEKLRPLEAGPKRPRPSPFLRKRKSQVRVTVYI